MLCEFAFANNMTIMSTQFQHHQVHKVTWISLDHTTKKPNYSKATWIYLGQNTTHQINHA